MAGSTTVGTAVVKLSFDGKDVKAQLAGIGNEIEKSGKDSGQRWGDAWSVAAGSLISKGISKISSTISNNLGRAISRVDTINNFPKVMTALGYSSDEASDSIDTISGAIDGLPTALDSAVSDVQKLAATMGNLSQGTVNATSVGIALNNMFLAGGKGTEAASNAMEQYNQMLAAGKADMQSWRSILDAAPGQLKQLARTLLGATATQDDLRNALNDGTISFDQMNEAIVNLNKNGGDGFASFEEQARTATGGIGTALENVQNRIGKAIAKVIDHIGSEKIAEVINNISSSFSGMADVVIGFIDFLADNQWIFGVVLAFFASKVLVSGITKITSSVAKLKNSFQGLFSKKALGGVAEKTGSIFNGLGTTLNNVVTKLGQIMTSLVNSLVGPLKAALKGISEALAGFFQALANPAVMVGAASFAVVAASIAAAIWLIGSAVGAIMPVLNDLFNNIIMPIAQFIADTLMSLIENLTNAVVFLTQGALIPLGEFLTSAFVQILTTVADVISNVTNGALVPLINTLSGAFTDVIRTISDLINGVLNAALRGIAEVIRAVGEGFLMMGQAIKLALEGVQGVLQAFAALIMAIAAAAVAIVALVTGHSINYGDNYAHLFSKGGKVEGPGTSTSDSIPAMLSDGEYVINAKSAQAIGYDNLDRMNEGDYYSFAGLASDFTDDYSATPATSGGITVYMTNQINNEMDAEDIGRVMMQSIRRAA